MDIISNREWAVLFWGIAGLMVLITKDKDRQIAASIGDVITSFFASRLVILYLVISVYEFGAIVLLAKGSLWDASQTKTALFWYVGSGLSLSFRLVQHSDDEEFLKFLFLDSIKLLVLIEYLAGLRSFTITTEFILTPILFFISVCYYQSLTDEKYAPARKMFGFVLGGYGIAVIWNSISYIRDNYSEFSASNPVLDILFPILLTILFIPFLYLLRVYVTYERIFGFVGAAITDKKLAFRTKIRALLRFRLNLKLLDSWSHRLWCQPVEKRQTREGIENSFKEIGKITEVEASTDIPDPSEGWPPPQAKSYLASQGLHTRHYHPLDEAGEEWWAGSNPLELDKELLPSSIAYYIDGNEGVVKELKLQLHVFRNGQEETAISSFVSASMTLFEQALDREAPGAITNLIYEGCEFEQKLGRFNVSYSIAEMFNPEAGYITTLSIKAFDRR